jgi:hypothetical protein
VLGSGLVATPFDLGVFFVVGPRSGRGQDRNPFISPVAQEGGGRMLYVVQFFGQVRAPTELAHKFCPGWRGFKCKGQTMH